MKKPMLASKVNLDKLVLPCYASPKIDGFRATVQGSFRSRTLKRIPNNHMQTSIEGYSWMENLDGELTAGEPNEDGIFHKTASAAMTASGTPNFVYNVFDFITESDITFEERYKMLEQYFNTYPGPDFVRLVKHILITTMDELLEYESAQLALGYEGIMLRSLVGKYKFGRSTVNEGYSLKLKRLETSEAEIIGWTELMHNNNEAVENALGLKERSSHAENKVPGNMLGNFIVRDTVTNVEFEIGTGFTKDQRTQYWKDRQTLLDLKTLVHYSYFPVGVKDKPRHPVFKGFRSKDDL